MSGNERCCDLVEKVKILVLENAYPPIKEIVNNLKIPETSIQEISSSKQLSQIIKKEDFDAIIIPYKLPTTNGLNVYKKVKKMVSDSIWALLTEMNYPNLPIEAINMGLDFYFEKHSSNFPEQFKSFINMIRNHKKNTKASLIQQKRFSLQETLVKIATSFIKTSDIDRTINTSLEEFGQLVDVDCIFLFQFLTNKIALKLTHYWCIDQLRSGLQNLPAISKESISWWINTLEKKGKVIIKNVKELPPKANRTKKLLKEHNIKSAYAFPLKIREELIGYIGFATIRNQYYWSEESINSLQTFASIIESSMETIQQQQEIKEKEERLSLLFNKATDAIMLVDLNEEGEPANFLEVNTKVCELTGKTKEELLKISPLEFMKTHEGDISPALEKLLQEKESLFEFKFTDSKGKELFLEINAHLINFRGKTAVLAIARDVTERKKSERMLYRYQQQIEKERDELESFASTIAHDIRGKLQVISLYSSQIKSKRTRNKIEKQIKEIANFLNNLLLLAKTGKILGKFEKVNLNKLIQKIAAKLRPMAPDLQIKIKDLPTIRGDPLKLTQVFENIINNVIQHASATKVEIFAEETRKDHFIYVRDNGEGISKLQQLKILQSLSSKKYSSFGLLIVLKIIHAHQGNLTIESSNEGTTIMIQLPKKG